jgi:hypothetical protein
MGVPRSAPCLFREDQLGAIKPWSCAVRFRQRDGRVRTEDDPDGFVSGETTSPVAFTTNGVCDASSRSSSWPKEESPCPTAHGSR